MFAKRQLQLYLVKLTFTKTNIQLYLAKLTFTTTNIQLYLAKLTSYIPTHPHLPISSQSSQSPILPHLKNRPHRCRGCVFRPLSGQSWGGPHRRCIYIYIYPHTILSKELSSEYINSSGPVRSWRPLRKPSQNIVKHSTWGMSPSKTHRKVSVRDTNT